MAIHSRVRRAVALAVAPAFFGVMGLGHVYLGRGRRALPILVAGLALEATIITAVLALGPYFTGWATPGFIAPGNGEIRGIGFSSVVTGLSLSVVAQVLLFAWQARDAYVLSKAST